MEASMELLEVIQEKGIDIFGNAETNVNWTKTEQEKMRLAIKLRNRKGVIATGSYTGVKEGYQQGVTALYLKGNVIGRITQ